MDENTTRIVTADGGATIRAGLGVLLGAHPSLHVAGEARGERDLLKQVTLLVPNVLIIDPYTTGCEIGTIAPRLLDMRDDLKILVFSEQAGVAAVQKALQAGVRGYLLKSAEQQELIESVLRVREDETALSPQIAAKLITRNGDVANASVSHREQEIVYLISQGMTNKEISQRLCVSEATIKTYTKRLFDKLGVNNRSAAVRVALERDVLPPAHGNGSGSAGH